MHGKTSYKSWTISDELWEAVEDEIQVPLTFLLLIQYKRRQSTSQKIINRRFIKKPKRHFKEYAEQCQQGK